MNAREIKEYISSALTKEEKEVINKMTVEEFDELTSSVAHVVNTHLTARMPRAI